MGPASRSSTTTNIPRGSLAIGGLFLFVFATLALSGPGRIDIVDGQARYLVARSLVDHGDPVVRDSSCWFSVLPGRDGNHYSSYRLPQSLAGVPAIWLADATGPVSENRRQFFFSQIGAVAGAVLAVIYLLWFRSQGHRPIVAVGWALGGIFCTPSWFYATSTFDDLLGAVFVVAAVCIAWWGSRDHVWVGFTLAGVALGLAFNSKQPLGIFVLPVLALAFTAKQPRLKRFAAAALTLSGLAAGLAVYAVYEWYKFPPGTTGEHAQLLAAYLPAWPGDTLAGLSALLFSPAAGVFFYCPTVVLGLVGLARIGRKQPAFGAALTFGMTVFVVFVSTMSFFKGDPCWGPRYLTPVFALLWLFVPIAATACSVRFLAFVLGLGMVVQILGLSVDPHRLYVYHRLPSAFYAANEWIYFNPAVSHLLNRPREIQEILQDDSAEATSLSPARLPTSAPPLLDEMELGPEAIRKYRFLASARPWWISQQWLAPSERPVALEYGVVLLSALSIVGLVIMVVGARSHVQAPDR